MTESVIYPCDKHMIFIWVSKKQVQEEKKKYSGQRIYLEGAVNTSRKVGKLSIERKWVNKGRIIKSDIIDSD